MFYASALNKPYTGKLFEKFGEFYMKAIVKALSSGKLKHKVRFRQPWAILALILHNKNMS